MYRQGFVLDQHCSVDGTMIEAWASNKSFVRKDASGPELLSGYHRGLDKCSNATHESTTDPQSRLYKKSKLVLSQIRVTISKCNPNRHVIQMMRIQTFSLQSQTHRP
jgi:hypothetical protein